MGTKSGRLSTGLGVAAAAALVVSFAATDGAGAAPGSKRAPGIPTSAHSLSVSRAAGSALPKGVPTHGSYAFLLKLGTTATGPVYNAAKAARGTASARSAAKAQLAVVKSAQRKVVAALPARSSVLYRTHAALATVAVVTDVKNYPKLKAIGNVTAVYPISPKRAANSYAVPLQRAPQAWTATGNSGQDVNIAVIDSGVDYTHANFGGPGTVPAYKKALKSDTEPMAPGSYDPEKFDPTTMGVDGLPAHVYDFAGDTYDASDPDNDVPAPDPNPLDCDSHGSHVSGIAAGYGVKANGNTYRGAYNTSTPFDSMRIGPGMAPKARLWEYRVISCAGSTNVVSEAIDKAMDPNNDGSTSDHADVVNMSVGSDFSSPLDGDSQMTNAASLAGVVMVVASGNGGDLYDVGGSPGAAVRALTVANSQDAYSQDDTLVVTAPASLAGDYAALRAQAFDWTKGDLHGEVVRLTDPDNLDGCAPLNATDRARVAGKIVFEEWTDDDYSRACGSVARGAILEDTDAIGFIFADDQNAFSAGITGSEKIPGVLLAKSGADAMRAELLAGHTVIVGGTRAGDFRQLLPFEDDTLSTSSSRGVRGEGNVKPDVTAVGTSVFSTGMGTGDEGLNDSGTSMASPMVAGEAALVRAAHSSWNPEQVKADIMNTAVNDLYTGENRTGDKYGPNRVGAGRIDAQRAVASQVLAYVTNDPGAVSASFGPIAVVGSQTVTRTKTIKVENTGSSSATYAVSYQPRTTLPGVGYTLSRNTVTVAGGHSATVKVTLTIHPSQLDKTIDPTVHRTQEGLPRQYLADASGLVVLAAQGGSELRVPVYSAPRPASAMTQPSALSMPRGSIKQATLPLTGQPVDQGAGANSIQSIVAGFELQAKSGMAPKCTDAITTRCVNFADERSSDLKYVGVTSDVPQLKSIGANPLRQGLVYFAVTTQGPWRTAVGVQQYLIWIDGNNDGVADSVLLNARIPAATVDTDVLISELIDLNTGDVLDLEGLNDTLGDTDTAMFDSDTLVLPTAIDAIPGVGGKHSRIHYVVEAYSGYENTPIDSAGRIDGDTLEMSHPLTFDVLQPGVAVYGSYTGNSSALLYADVPGQELTVRRDLPQYKLDKGVGILMVHFHNVVGNKAQVVQFA